jgi:hypothetical protein
MQKARVLAMAVAAAAALSCAGCLIFTIVDAIDDSFDPGHGPDKATVLFDNGTNETLTCSVNGSYAGTVNAFQQLAVRVTAGENSLEATSAARSWGPFSVDLPKDATYTWRILPNG